MNDTTYQGFQNAYAAVRDAVGDDQMATDIIASMQNYGVQFVMQPYTQTDDWKPYTKADFERWLAEQQVSA
jgi:predicted HAD superfamily phosphohydrolase YqeG